MSPCWGISIRYYQALEVNDTYSGNHQYGAWSNDKTCACAGDNHEDEDEDQHDYPDSNNDSDGLHLTPSSSGLDVLVNTKTSNPSTLNNWYYLVGDTESCSSCDFE